MSEPACEMNFEAHPELFDVRAMPEQPKVLKSGQLDGKKIKQFFEEGFLIVPDFFEKTLLEACKRDVEVLVDELAQMLYRGGKITSLYSDKGVFERLTFVEKEFPGANVIMIKRAKMMPAFQDLWSNERLLNLAEQLIGPEIMGHPVWNLRVKVPQNEATTVPWHQDCGYLDDNCADVLQLTAWIPLLDANERNGCLEVMSGGHLTGKVARHTCCWGNTWYIELDEKEMEKSLNVDVQKDKVLCPVPYGGLLLMNNMIPHRSLNNLSADIRWSLDLRWQTPEKSVAFYGLKEGVLMRSQKNPVTKIDWDSFNSVNRETEATSACRKDETVDKFDTILVGPWMKKWEITHKNRHTERLLSSEAQI